jgi:hypothetical protein
MSDSIIKNYDDGKNKITCNMNRELYECQYTEKELEEMINDDKIIISTRRILATQKNISKKFIEDYVLNSNYHVDDADESITWDDVNYYRPDLQYQYENQKSKHDD